MSPCFRQDGHVSCMAIKLYIHLPLLAGGPQPCLKPVVMRTGVIACTDTVTKPHSASSGTRRACTPSPTAS